MTNPEEQEQQEEVEEAAEALARKSIDNPRAQEILLQILPEISRRIGELHKERLAHRKKGKGREQVREDRKGYSSNDYDNNRMFFDHCPQCARLRKEKNRLRDERDKLYFELNKIVAANEEGGAGAGGSGVRYAIGKEETKLARKKLRLLLKLKKEEEEE